jgi:hypothetical protein
MRPAPAALLLAAAVCAGPAGAGTLPGAHPAARAGLPPGEPGAQPPQRCASGPGRENYVSLRATTPSDLASLVAGCERLGYRRIGGVARAVVANPGAASAQWYFQVMIVPAGAASAPSPAGSAAH